MPLSEPVPREEMHRRAITIRGYHRNDGLFDIEAHLTDSRSKGFETADRGFIAPGEFLHEMWARMTIDDAMRIVASQAATDFGPLALCPGGATSFSRLAGLTIKPGFLKEAYARIGGVAGCTHLRELLQQMATTAFQTMVPVRGQRDASTGLTSASGPPRLLNSCFAFASDSPAVRRRWPAYYTGPDADRPDGDQG
jgi:hypothetical protein